MTTQDPPNLRDADKCANCNHVWFGWGFADIVCIKYNRNMDADEDQVCDDYVRAEEGE